MKAAGLAFLILFMTVTSCKKSSNGITATPDVYMTLAAASAWTYETVNNLTVTTTSNIVLSTSRDTAIGGKSYHVFSNSNGGANDYYNVSGNDYYTFKNLVSFGSNSVEHIYLKDNAAAGTSWSQTVTIAPFSGVPTTLPLTITNTIAEKGISRTVNSKVYNNVIKISTSLSFSSLPAGSLISDIQSYYAPKYGLIESKYKITTTLLTGSNVDQTTSLKSASF
jgi:hypothetical protein